MKEAATLTYEVNMEFNDPFAYGQHYHKAWDRKLKILLTLIWRIIKLFYGGKKVLMICIYTIYSHK